VIGGFRYGQNLQGDRKVVGSILLGLYDDDGLLHHVGYSSAVKAKDIHQDLAKSDLTEMRRCDLPTTGHHGDDLSMSFDRDELDRRQA
jgi:ATP-dependent DNA ligase